MKKYIFAAAVIVLLIMSVVAAGGHPFADVPDGAYYAEAVQWAWENGITQGVDATHFDPDRAITRAEMVTLLWRMNADETEETPTPTTFKDRPREPYAPEPTVWPEYSGDYYGRLTMYDEFDRYEGHAFFSIGLYDCLDSEMVDLDDSAFIMERGGCYAIGDHNYPSGWVIRYAGPGDVLEIRVSKTGEFQRYKYLWTDRHVRNAGSDFLFDSGESCFYTGGADLFFATCNDDGGGKYVTAAFFKRIN